MASKTFTFALLGAVPLDLFADSIRNLSGMLEELSAEIDPNAKIEWLVTDLNYGSAELTMSGEAEKPASVERAVEAVRTVGRALEQQEPIPFGPRVRQHAEAITRHINERGRITAVRFETPDDTFTVFAALPSAERPVMLQAYGTVKGKILTLSGRRGLSFILYDALFDKPVTCYLHEGQEDLVRDKWERHAVVEGQISRDPFTGRAVTVREISDVQALPDFGEGDPYMARGVIPWNENDEKPELVIRRLRDEW